MKVIERYIASEIVRAVFFVLLAFLALFAFFDLMGELKNVGRNNYELRHAFLYVIMGLPGYVYDLMPIAALIGGIYALSQLAARSEFTIMRVSSLSTARAIGILAKIGCIFLLITFLFGEFIAPATSEMAEKLKLQVRGTSISQEFRSGLWAKDVIRRNGLTGEQIGSRFVNVREVRSNGQLRGIKLYEFDQNFRLKTVITAAQADYKGQNIWHLASVSETRFDAARLDTSATVLTKAEESRNLVSEITPELLSVVFADPDRMSASGLASYTKHLEENNQNSGRYELAFWKKIIYPFAVFVMLALALPFAYLHFRAGGVSLKIFIGIMIGVSFQLLNSLFSHLGLLNTWPPLATALAPSLFFLLIATMALWWIQRR